MPEKIAIRKMRPDDLEQVALIEQKNFSEPWSVSGFEDSLKSKDTLFFIAEENGRILGYCGLYHSFEEGEITSVAVDERYRKRGIARRMLTDLMEEGKRRGIQRFILEVRKSNAAAIHLYESLGFHAGSIRKNFYSKPAEDAVVMWT